MSLFKDGELKPGIYKIQNIVGQTYVDVRDRSRELCCRPATVLEGKGQWEILSFGPGYTIRRIEKEKPDQFCTVLSGSTDKEGRVSVSVSTFPGVWRVEIVRNQCYKGCEYIRFFWGTTSLTWDLADFGSDKDNTPVHYGGGEGFQPCRIWKLIPVRLYAIDSVPEASTIPTPASSILPPYDGNLGGQRCTHSHQTTEVNNDVEYGTTVIETTTTNTITTQKKYRVE